MTQKNGTIEFIKEEGQSPHVYIQEIKSLISFNKMSKKFFTHNPAVIKKLDSLGYKRGKVKIDGVAVLASSMTDDEAKRAQRNLDRQSEKVGIETPKLKPEIQKSPEENQTIIEKGNISTGYIPDAETKEIEVEASGVDIAENLVKKEEVKPIKTKVDVDPKIEEKKANKVKKKKASSKLEKEIRNK